MTKSLKQLKRNISTALKNERLELGISQKDLAKASRVSERQIVTIEKDGESTNPTLDTLDAISRSLGIYLPNLIDSSIPIKKEISTVQVDRIINHLESLLGELQDFRRKLDD